MSPQSATAEADELDRGEAAILARLNGGGLGLRDFIKKVAPHEPPPPHLDPLIDAIERARHERVQILLSMPPGHAKTLTILRAIAWWLSATPADTCAYLSYSDTQAWGKSKICRSIAMDADIELDGEFGAAAEWRTTNGGGLLASGVDGRLTGNRVTGFAVIDDPFKSYQDAASPTTRESVWSWYATVVKTRLQDASIIVVHTRWHPDDLIGRLERQGGWEIINLPAIADNDNGKPDFMGRAHGQALWPDMYPAHELLETKRTLGDFYFSAMYQGQPRAPGAKVFLLPARFDLARFDPTGCEFLIGVDPAASKATSADWSVAVLMARRKRPGLLPVFYILKVLREQLTIPTFCTRLRMFQVANGNATAYVESVGGFKAVPQIMREIENSLLVEEVFPHGDKFQRAQPMAAAWNDPVEQRVLVPYAADWDVEAFIAEFKDFTGVADAQDDQVDGASTVYNAFTTQVAPPAYVPREKPVFVRRR